MTANPTPERMTPEAARECVDSLDDFARMTVGVDPHGPREALYRFIDQYAALAQRVEEQAGLIEALRFARDSYCEQRDQAQARADALEKEAGRLAEAWESNAEFLSADGEHGTAYVIDKCAEELRALLNRDRLAEGVEK